MHPCYPDLKLYGFYRLYFWGHQDFWGHGAFADCFYLGVSSLGYQYIVVSNQKVLPWASKYKALSFVGADFCTIVKHYEELPDETYQALLPYLTSSVEYDRNCTKQIFTLYNLLKD